MYAFASALHRVALAAAAALLGIVFVIGGLGVIFRYVVQRSLPWTDETAAYLFIWLAFLGAAAEVWTEGHPRITFLVDRLGARAQAIATVLARLAVAAWGLVLLWYGWQAVLLEKPETWSSVPELSLQIPYAVIPLAGALIIVFAIGKMAKR